MHDVCSTEVMLSPFLTSGGGGGRRQGAVDDAAGQGGPCHRRIWRASRRVWRGGGQSNGGQEEEAHQGVCHLEHRRYVCTSARDERGGVIDAEQTTYGLVLYGGRMYAAPSEHV